MVLPSDDFQGPLGVHGRGSWSEVVQSFCFATYVAMLFSESSHSMHCPSQVFHRP